MKEYLILFLLLSVVIFLSAYGGTSINNSSYMLSINIPNLSKVLKKPLDNGSQLYDLMFPLVVM